MIPGFEDNLVGLEAGANKIFSVTFPADYGNTALAGKAAEFNVDVIKLKKPYYLKLMRISLKPTVLTAVQLSLSVTT